MQQHQARIQHQQSRWLRHDAARWIRPDAARFLAPGTCVQDAYPALDPKYSPNQPRVPAGHSGGGQWTSGGRGGRSRLTSEGADEENGGEDGEVFDDTSLSEGFDGDLSVSESLDDDTAISEPRDSELDDIFAAHDRSLDAGSNPDNLADRITDPRIVSDADPESVKPGEQYAQAGRGRAPTNVRINAQSVEVSPAQAARLEIARSRAEDSIARVREIDRDWKPAASAYESVNGLIRAYEGNAAQAQSRMNELAAQRLAPGPFTSEVVVSNGSARPTGAEREAINRIGRESGCHTCGTRESGLASGNFIVDHQPPTALNWSGRLQRLLPHCASCSSYQGPTVRDFPGRRR